MSRIVKLVAVLFILFFANQIAAAEEHCLVVRAMATAAYDARMQLLVGTDRLFTQAYWAQQTASKKVSEKYRALFEARDQKGNEENPENHFATFKSSNERQEFFRKWDSDIKALEAAENSEIQTYSDAFERAMNADPDPVTQQRLAQINAQWKREFNASCYWGPPK